MPNNAKFWRRASIGLAFALPLAIFGIVRQVASWRPVRIGIENSNNQSLIVSPDGKHLVVFGEYGDTETRPDYWKARGWDLENATDHALRFGRLTPARFSPDGQSVLSLYDGTFGGLFDGGVLAQSHDFRSGRLNARFADKKRWEFDDPEAVQFTKDNRLVIASSFEGVRFYDARTAQLEKRVTLHPNPPSIAVLSRTNLGTRTSLSEDGKSLMTTNPPALWDVASGRRLQQLPVPKCDRSGQSLFAPDLSVIIWENKNTTGPQGAPGWSITDPFSGRVLWQTAKNVSGLAISPDSQSVLLSALNRFELRQIKNSHLIRSFPKPDHNVYRVAISAAEELFYLDEQDYIWRQRLR